jgi:hypothetical protein
MQKTRRMILRYCRTAGDSARFFSGQDKTLSKPTAVSHHSINVRIVCWQIGNAFLSLSMSLPIRTSQYAEICGNTAYL